MKTTITINFDMDGTIADLYGVKDWLSYLQTEDVYPYSVAQPLVRLSSLARKLNFLQKQGYRLGIISWLSKCGSDEYNEAVTEAKKRWLSTHLPSVHWDSIIIVPYGTPKQNFSKSANDILFDDEAKNRENWIGQAFDVNNIMEVLKNL